MKLLVIEDDLKLLSLIAQQLRKVGFGVTAAANATEGLFQATEFTYDCIVLDVNLPDSDGFQLCQKLRQQQNITPILMMTARDSLQDKIRGLDLGADDYVLKPVDTAELIARIRALIRRSSKEPLPVITVGDLTIDPQTRRVQRAGEWIDLPTKEFAVLEFLARHSDEVVTRTMMMEHVWGDDFESFSNVIDVYIKNLRQKIDRGFKQKLIHTIRGGGYSLSNKR